MNSTNQKKFSRSTGIEVPVLAIRLQLHIPHSHSLKEKRKVVRSLKERLRHRFNVTVAEVGTLDKWQVATIMVAMVSKDRTYLNEQTNKIRTFVDNELIGAGELIAFQVQIL